MPQLMPLMWVSSVMISMFILMTLFDMFYYKENYNLYMNVNQGNLEIVKMEW